MGKEETGVEAPQAEAPGGPSPLAAGYGGGKAKMPDSSRCVLFCGQNNLRSQLAPYLLRTPFLSAVSLTSFHLLWAL